MAKNGKDLAKEPALDISDMMPEGISEADLKKTGGFTPTFKAGKCANADGSHPPVAGWLLGWLEMPPVKGKEEREWSAIAVELTGPTTAIIDDVPTRVEAGTVVLVPVTGQLKVNEELRRAAYNPSKIYWGYFQVTGQKDVGEVSPMWVVDVKIALTKPKAREGLHALYNREEDRSQLPATSGRGAAQTASA